MEIYIIAFLASLTSFSIAAVIGLLVYSEIKFDLIKIRQTIKVTRKRFQPAKIRVILGGKGWHGNSTTGEIITKK
ncbi:MAG: hypothetical protein H0W84_11950 [Bacteroidetes bacterium]|nr:hypothetical protein [Bacteroidota bacterium]